MTRFGRLLLCTLAAALLTAASGYQVNYGSNQNITEWSTCKNVSNNSPTGKAIFVPTNTSTEWAAFYNASTPGVTIANCGCAVTAGSQSWTSNSTNTFTVPCYNTLTVTLWGAGAGGGGMNSSGTAQTASTAGTASTWDGGNASGHPEAGGGSKASTTRSSSSPGGPIYNCDSGSAGGDGQGGGTGGNSGSGSGHGNAGAANASNTKVNGGAATAAGGGGGGASVYASNGGFPATFTTRNASGGGGGGYCVKTFAAGDYVVGAHVTVVVGKGGAGGNSNADGGTGFDGKVTITWN